MRFILVFAAATTLIGGAINSISDFGISMAVVWLWISFCGMVFIGDYVRKKRDT